MESRPARSADDELMRAFGDGEESALQELFIRFGADMYGIGLRCFPADGRAEAFVERTFLTMLHRSSQYTSRSMPPGHVGHVPSARGGAKDVRIAAPRTCPCELGWTEEDRS